MSVWTFAFVSLWFLVAGLPSQVEARPEYALKQKTNCTTCHALPMGAGPRNIAGKVFGSRSYPPATTSFNDLYYGDIRAEYFRPRNNVENSRNGLALMVAAVSGNIPIKTGTKYDLRYVGTFDMGAFSSGSREQTLLWTKKEASGWLPHHILFGKYYLPFGLLTDEHRTYTKMQTRSSFRDYDMGVNLSWDFLGASHFDLSVTNGYQSAGQGTNNDLTSAVTTNLRLNLPGPFMIGGSYSKHESKKKVPDTSTATSVYTGVDFGKLTANWFNATLTGEWVTAKGWNDPAVNSYVGSFFSSNTTFTNSIKLTESEGYYGLLRWDLVDYFALMAKYDRLAFDKSFPGDQFERLGYGFIWQFDANFTIIARYEDGKVGRKELETTTDKASQDLIFVMLRGWI